MMPHTDASAQARRDASVERYILALDAADFETVAAVLTEAVADPALAQLLAEVDEVLHDEIGLVSFQEQSRTVRTILRKHLPSASTEAETGPPTVGDVAGGVNHGQDALMPGDLS